MPHNATLDRLAAFAGEQWGLVTRRQAEQSGIPKTTLDRLTAHGSVLERVGHGVYKVAGAPRPDHLDLRAAWLQLAPEVPVWERTPDQGIASHRSATALYGIGDLPADRHEFTVLGRRQSRRPDVRLHTRHVDPPEWVNLRGLYVTRPPRIASDLLHDREDPSAVARIVAESIRGGIDRPEAFTGALAPHSAGFGLRRDDGLALLAWLLDLTAESDAPKWIREARDAQARGEAGHGRAVLGAIAG